MSEAAQLVCTLILGFVTGVLSAMFGVGGAILSTPAIRLLGASPLTAVGTTLPCILPSAVAGTVRYAREGLVHWDTVKRTAPLGSMAAVVGARLSHSVPGNGTPLMMATAAVLFLVALRMARREGSAPPSIGEATGLRTKRKIASARNSDVSRARSSTRAVVGRGSRLPEMKPVARWSNGQPLPRMRPAVVGIIAGGMSGLLGIGGGMIMVPAFTEWFRLSTRQAVSTSLACVGILAVPGTLAHALLGGIDWGFAVPLSIAVIPGASLGSHIAVRATDQHLRRALAAVLAVLAVCYGAAEALALR